MQGKKAKGKKGKKPVKQQQQKFGFMINLDQQEPDIPVEKTQAKQEQEFKVIYAQQFKQERLEPSPQNNQPAVQAQTLQLGQTQTAKPTPSWPENTCEQKQQLVKQQDPIKYQNVGAGQVNGQKQQIREEAVEYNIIQGKVQQSQISQSPQNSQPRVQIETTPIIQGELRKDPIFQTVAQAKVPQISLRKQSVQPQQLKGNELQLDQDLQPKIVIQNKVTKKQASKVGGNKKKQTKQKSKKAVTASLNLEIEQFQEKIQPYAAKQQVPSNSPAEVEKETANNQINQIQPQQIDTLAKKQVIQVQREQLKVVPDQPVVIEAIQSEIQANIHQYMMPVSLSQVEAEVKQAEQLLERYSSRKNQIIKVQDDDLQLKMLGISSKPAKKSKKTKTTKKEQKLEIKLSLQTQTVLLEQIAEQSRQPASKQNQSSIIAQPQAQPLKAETSIQHEKAPLPQEIHSPAPDRVVQPQKISQVIQQPIIRQPKDEEIVDKDSKIRQQQILTPPSQVIVAKEEKIQQHIPVEQDIEEIQLIEMQVKVSKVKASKKQVKKDGKSKSNTKMQKQLNMQMQLEQTQFENISIAITDQPNAADFNLKAEQITPGSRIAEDVPQGQIEQKAGQLQNHNEFPASNIQTTEDTQYQLSEANNIAQQTQIDQRPQLRQHKVQFEQPKVPNNQQQLTYNQFQQNVPLTAEIPEPQKPEIAQRQSEQQFSSKQQKQDQSNLVPESHKAAEPYSKTEFWQVNVELGQVMQAEKSKLQVNKKNSKKKVGKAKPKANLLKMGELVLEVQQQLKPLQTTEPVPLISQHLSDESNLKGQDNQIAQQNQIQNSAEEPTTSYASRIDSAIPTDQSPILIDKPVILTEQELQRQRQLEFYNKLQQEHQFQLNAQQHLPLQSSPHQATVLETQVIAAEAFSRAAELPNNQDNAQRQIEAGLRIKTSHVEQAMESNNKQEALMIDLQGQEAPTKIVLSQTSKAKPKTNKKPVKKTKAKQITTILTESIIDFHQQQPSTKQQIQKSQLSFAGQAGKLQRNTEPVAQVHQHIPSSTLAQHSVSSAPSDLPRQSETNEKTDQASIIQPKLTNLNDRSSVISNQTQIITQKLVKSERYQTSPSTRPVAQTAQKQPSQHKKTVSIVAQLIDMIRFKGDEDMRSARERLNMLQQDVRSRLLHKGKRHYSGTRQSEGAQLYGSIIDENINLRHQLRSIAHST